MAKASDNAFPSILLVEQGSAPSTPSSGQARLYRGTDNKLYVKDDAGTSTEVGAGGGSAPGAWTAWTPVLTAVTTNPTIGTGGNVVEGYYSQHGKTVTGWFGIQFGSSGNSGGSGEWRVSLPVAAVSAGTTVPIGSASGFNPTGIFSILRQSTTTMKFWASGAYVGSGTSGAGSSGSQLWGSFTYEAA